MSDQPFMLFDHQVPDFPDGNLWNDHLRWLVCVMNPDDTSLHFVASILSHSLKGGLTDRQAKAAQKILTRVSYDYQAGALDCQNNDECTPYSTPDLADMVTEGEA